MPVTNLQNDSVNGAVSDLSIDVDVNGGAASRELERIEKALAKVEQGVSKLARATTASDKSLKANAAATDKLASSLGNLSNQTQRAERSARQFNSGLNDIRAAVAGLGLGIAINEVRQLADEFTIAENKLAYAGITGARLDQTMGNLADIAVRTRTEFASIATLYSKMTMASEELKLSMTDVGRITETTAKALVGVSSGERSSAVTQLVQGLASGNLAGDELKAIRENSIVLSQAIAREFGVSVGKLKELGAEGKLEAGRVAKAILAAEGQINEAFGRTNATMADAVTNFKTRFGEYVSGVDDAVGASEKFFAALTYAGEHLDDIGDAALLCATILGGALAGQAMTAVVRGTIAMNLAFAISGQRLTAMTVGASAARVAMTGLRGAMAFLGGPIGVALTAASIGVALLAKRSMDAAQATEELRARVAEKKAALDAARASADQARRETGNLTAAETKAATEAAKLTGEQDKLANAYYRVAAAAKAAALEQALARQSEARADREAADRDYNRRLNQEQRRARGPGYYGSADGRQAPPPGLDRVVTSTANSRIRGSQEERTRTDARAVEAAANAEVTELRNRRLSTFAPQTVASTTDAKSKGSGSRGMSEAERAAERYAKELKNLQEQEALLALTERDRAAAQALLSAAMEADLTNLSDRGQAVADLALRVYDLQKAEEDAATAKTMLQQAEEELLDLQRQALAVNNPAAARTAEINAQYDANVRIINALKVNEETQRRLLAIEQQRRDAALEIERAYAEKANRDANRALDRQGEDLALRRRALTDPEGARREQARNDNQRSREDAIEGIDLSINRQGEEYRRLVERINQLHDEELAFIEQNFKLEEFMRLYEGLSDFFTDLFDDPKQALKEYATLFLQEIAKMIFQAKILKETMGSKGGSGGGWGDIIKQAAVNVFGGGRAIGGPLDPSKYTLVGEHGPELITRTRGHVIPAGATKAALAGGSRGGSVGTFAPVMTQHIQFSGSRDDAEHFSRVNAAEQNRQLRVLWDKWMREHNKFKP